MSRCFPFPPPGYEKKARIDDVDLLKKAAHKEKRHKKEKKDKEKREHKDREEKDKKSNEKHRDKKGRKEKSKEKKKDEGRKKDRDKASTSQEKHIPAVVESCNGDRKHNHKDREWTKDQNITSNEKKPSTPFLGHIGEKPVETSLSNEGVVDKFVLDLCTRIKDEEKGYASQSMERSPFTGRTNHERMGKNGILPIDKEKKEDRRVDIRKISGQGVSVGGTISVKIESGNMPVEKGKTEDNRVDVRNMGGQGVTVGAAFSVCKMVPHITGKEKNKNRGPNIGGGFQNKAEEIPRIMEKSTEPRDKDQKKKREEKRESKRKDKDKEKKSHGKDKERDKEKKKERVKEKNEQKIKVKDTVKNGLVVTQNIKLPPLIPDGERNPVVNQNKTMTQPVPNGERNPFLGENVKLPPFFPDGDRNPVISQNLKLSPVVPNGDGNLFHGQNIKLPPFVLEGDKTPSVEVNLKKRKDSEANECLYESNVAPNKKPRPTPHPFIQNGRKLEPCQTPVLTTDRKVPPPNNEQKINGKIGVQPLSISLKKPPSSLPSPSSSSSKIKADQIAKAPQVKLPHPDTKYLNEVLSVPKIVEWCDVDDEEWLFSSKGHITSSVSRTEALETPRVWAEAVKIESADVCALPYVIPY